MPDQTSRAPGGHAANGRLPQADMFANPDDFVRSDEDVTGLVAFGLHARGAAAWRKDALARLGREPTPEEWRAFHAGQSIADLRARAARMLAGAAAAEPGAPGRAPVVREGRSRKPDGRPPLGRLVLAIAILTGFVVVLARIMEPLSAWLFPLSR